MFGKPLSHKAALVKAALATAFIVHELKIAYTDAQSSPILTKLVSPLTPLHDEVSAMVAGLRAGHYDPAQINSAQGNVVSIAAQAGAAGAPIKDLSVPAFWRRFDARLAPQTAQCALGALLSAGLPRG